MFQSISIVEVARTGTVALSVSAESVNELKKNETTYEEIPFDKYYVSLAKMELTSSKKGDPMLSVRFRILEGNKV